MRIYIFLILIALHPELPGQSVKSVLDAMMKMDQGSLDKNLSADLAFIMEPSHADGNKSEGGLAQFKMFLSNNPIKSYKIIHEGVARGKEGFMGISSLITDKNKYRIYLSFKAEDNRYLVNQLRIEKDEL
ncbi:MAG: DUF4783 domain-containing protein [Saprospiraceae bacterium]